MVDYLVLIFYHICFILVSSLNSVGLLAYTAGMNKVYNTPHVLRQLQFPFFPLGIHLKFVRVLICQLLHAIVILPVSWFLS